MKREKKFCVNFNYYFFLYINTKSKLVSHSPFIFYYIVRYIVKKVVNVEGW